MYTLFTMVSRFVCIFPMCPETSVAVAAAPLLDRLEFWTIGGLPWAFQDMIIEGYVPKLFAWRKRWKQTKTIQYESNANVQGTHSALVQLATCSASILPSQSTTRLLKGSVCASAK